MLVVPGRHADGELAPVALPLPQARFPYEQLREENARRGRDQPEYELSATGIFDADRFFVVTVTWAKAAPEDILWQIEVQNVGPDARPSTCSPRSGSAIAGAGISAPYGRRSALRAGPTKRGRAIRAYGRRILAAGAGPDGKQPEALFCDNDTNLQKLWGRRGRPSRKTASPTT